MAMGNNLTHATMFNTLAAGLRYIRTSILA